MVQVEATRPLVAGSSRLSELDVERESFISTDTPLLRLR